MDWNKKLCDKYKNWNEENSTKIPQIIRNEYLRIFELLSNGHVYGAFYHIKDTFEIVIKFLVLTVISEMLEDSNISEDNSDIIFKLFEKPLGLGDWKIISKLVEDKSKYRELNDLICAINKIYDRKKITKWRNDCIGHSSLPDADSKAFIKDVSEKLEILNSYFQKQIINYSSIEYKITNNNLTFEYKNNLVFNFKYFLLIDNGQVFIFDSYINKKKKTMFLNYSNGLKFENESKDILELVEQLQFDSNKRVFKSNIEDEVFLVREDNIIKEISKIKDFVRPEFIVSEINQFINSHDKGVLLLKMEHGMGKSILSNALDEHGLNKIKIKDSIIRAYYVNDTYKSCKDNFVSYINDVFRLDKEGRILYQGKIPYIDEKSLNLRSEVSKLLSFYRDKYYNDTGKEKLVFIVDGLDEIVQKKDGSIFEYLPNESDLEKNVYVIYTSRTITELQESFFNINNISKISYTKDIEIRSNNDKYKEVLVNFIKTKYKGFEKEKVINYLSTLTVTFQYLKRICNVLENNQDIEIEKIFTNEYYEDEINNMYSKYGQKYFDRIMDILLLISLYDEPLKISDISCLLTNEKVNFELLFYIMNLKEYLYAERTVYGNCIRILDSDFNLFLKEKFSEKIREKANTLLRNCITEISKPEVINETSIYTLSNLDTLLQQSDFKIKDFSSEDIINNLLNIECSLSRNEVGSLKRLIKLQFQISEILDESNFKDQKYNIYKAILKSNQAEVYDLIGFTDRALKGFYESVRMFNRVQSYEYPFALLLSSRTYVKYALLCIKINNNHMAIISLENALKLYKLLEKAMFWKPNLKDYLYIYNNKGLAYQNLQKLEDAELEYNTAINMLLDNSVSSEEELNLEISMVYLNRGVIYIMKGQNHFNDALKDFDISLKYVDNGASIYDEQKAKILLNKSKVLLEIQRDKDALENIKLAIDILEDLKEKNMLIEDEILMKAYINNGIILDKLNEDNQAISCYNKAISIAEKLRNEERFINDYEFYKARFLLASSYGKLNNIKEEFNQYKRIIEIEDFDKRELLIIYLSSVNNLISLLDEETKIVDMDIIISWFDKLLEVKYENLSDEELLLFSNIINDVTIYLKEKDLYEKAIKYQKKLLLMYKKLDNKTEIKTIMMKDIGDCFLKLKQFDDTLLYYDESIKLMRKIHNYKFEFKKYLSEMLYNRSAIYVIKKLYQRAYDDAYESLILTNQCLENEIQIDSGFAQQRAKHLKMLYSHAATLGIYVR